MTRTPAKIQAFRLPTVREFREIYDESGISTLFSDYVRRMAVIVSVVFVLTAVSSALAHNLFFHLSPQRLFIVTASLSLVTTNITAFSHLLYPLYRRSQLRKEIENSLIYSLSYMNILSAGGGSIEGIMERVSEVEDNPQIRQLARKFVMDIRLLGFDVSATIEDVSRRTPSNILKKLLESIEHNMRMSGELKTLFTYEVERLFHRKREELKRLVRSLTFLGETYVAAMVVGPILFILMITILSVFSGAGTSSILQLNLIVFFGIPVLAAAFLIILDTQLEGDE